MSRKPNFSADTYGCIVEERNDRGWRLVPPADKKLTAHLDLALAWSRCEKHTEDYVTCGESKCSCEHELGPWSPVVDVVLNRITSFVRECQDVDCGYYQVRQVPLPVLPTEQEMFSVGIIPSQYQKPDYSKAPDWWGMKPQSHMK